MKRNIVLINKERFCKIDRCSHGVVHLHLLYKGISLHFDEECFLSFASMIDKAASRLMDEGLADLIKDSEREKEEY